MKTKPKVTYIKKFKGDENWAVYALLKKEILRFGKVWVQTILAPVISSLLFLIIFSYLLNGRLEPLPGVTYSSFLVPGLVMMTLQQNAFSNSSSSLTQSKISGNLIFLMLSPMRPWQWFIGYLGGSIVRGLSCGIVLWLFCLFVVQTPVKYPLWALWFAVMSCVLMGGLGIIAGIYAEKYDQISAFQNFLINPLTLLAGVFYSTSNLPDGWRSISLFNPFFYLIDGFRFGVFGVSDVTPWVSMFICNLSAIIVSTLCIYLISSGWRLKN
ncbi:MAG: metal-dependent hydrolase [Betaproteobacteria bacterium TMED41]|nr:MAG: metal-dependent hydrolase [Betaproteobacteria bacterium TMED41]|tara:strand:+ start:988 stop:1794 length:807 start_codon:yes stop_codon:yes gene_type:complete